MGFKKGNTFGKGRIKGSGNIHKKDIDECFADFNPLMNLKNLAKSLDLNDKDDKNLYYSCNKELCRYYAPQLKAIEVKGEEGEPMQFNITINGQAVDAKVNKLSSNEDSSKISS